MAGVGAESISALVLESISAPILPHIFFCGYGWGGYGIRPYGGDFNGSVNMVWQFPFYQKANRTARIFLTVLNVRL